MVFSGKSNSGPKYSSSINANNVSNMAEIVALDFLKHGNTRNLDDLVNDIVRVRFGDHPLFGEYVHAVRRAALLRVDDLRRAELALWIKDAARREKALGLPEEKDDDGAFHPKLR